MDPQAGTLNGSILLSILLSFFYNSSVIEKRKNRGISLEFRLRLIRHYFKHSSCTLHGLWLLIKGWLWISNIRLRGGRTWLRQKMSIAKFRLYIVFVNSRVRKIWWWRKTWASITCKLGHQKQVWWFPKTISYFSWLYKRERERSLSERNFEER